MKDSMLNIKHQIVEHPYMVVFFAVLNALLKFVIESWSVNTILFIFLFFLIAIDTHTGVKLAKLKNVYDYKLMKSKAIKKVLGYIVFMIALWTFTMMLFLMNLKDGQPVISNYYLNIPMMTTILFFAGIEFLSIKDNAMLIYGIKTPASITDRVEKLVNTGEIDLEKFLNKN